jgi:hypothetical protein
MTFTHSWFRRERLMIAARCCGAAGRLIEEATAFAKARMSGGQPIADYQAVQFMLADSTTELWAARLMTYECAAAHDRGADVKALHARCSMAKLYASEMANRVGTAWPTGRCRSSAGAATCARTSPSASSASCGSTASGRARARSSASSSLGRFTGAASRAF